MPRTTLKGSIGFSDTTIIVQNGTIFPVNNSFLIIIDNEIMKVKFRVGDTLTVVRAIENSIQDTHTNGVDVTQVFRSFPIEVQAKIDNIYGLKNQFKTLIDQIEVKNEDVANASKTVSLLNAKSYNREAYAAAARATAAAASQQDIATTGQLSIVTQGLIAAAQEATADAATTAAELVTAQGVAAGFNDELTTLFENYNSLAAQINTDAKNTQDAITDSLMAQVILTDTITKLKDVLVTPVVKLDNVKNAFLHPSDPYLKLASYERSLMYQDTPSFDPPNDTGGARLGDTIGIPAPRP